jgi:VIT1/CCC1 family predicted Fe2+/Mn2+ transporter
MRRRLLTTRLDTHPILVRRDYLEAFAVFLLVVIATFPVIAPFMVTSDPALAMELSRAISLTMLFLAGFALARYAGIARPVWIGIIMAVLGAVLIVTVMALGG